MNHGENERDSSSVGGAADSGPGGSPPQEAAPAAEGERRRRRRGRRGGRRHRRRREREGSQAAQPEALAEAGATAHLATDQPAAHHPEAHQPATRTVVPPGASSGPVPRGGEAPAQVPAGRPEAGAGSERDRPRRRRRRRGRRRHGEGDSQGPPAAGSAPPAPLPAARERGPREDEEEEEEYDPQALRDIAGSWKGAGPVELPQHPARAERHPRTEQPTAAPPFRLEPEPDSETAPSQEPAPAAFGEEPGPLVGERVEPSTVKRRRRRRRRKGAPASGHPALPAPPAEELDRPDAAEEEVGKSPQPTQIPYVGAPASELAASRRPARPQDTGAGRRRRLASPRAWYFGPTHWGPRATQSTEEILTPPLKRRRRRKG
jgi:ribonuclease E